MGDEDNASGGGNQGGAGDGNGTPSAEVIKAITGEFQKALDARVEGFMSKMDERLEERFKNINPKPTDSEPAGDRGAKGGKAAEPQFDPKAFERELFEKWNAQQAQKDFDASIANLDEEQAAKIKGFAKAHGFQAAVAALNTFAPSDRTGGDGQGNGAPKPKGQAARPSPGSVSGHPETVSEWKALKKNDPAAFEALQQDDSFDPKTLRRV